MQAMRELPAGLLYVLLVLAAGWVLGPARELLLAPAIGRWAAMLVEAPLMLGACILAARWTIRRLAVPPWPGARLRMGLAALAVLLLAEIAGSAVLRGIGPEAWLRRAATPEGALTLLLFALFAALPLRLVRTGPR
jgi:hypothetical protein